MEIFKLPITKQNKIFFFSRSTFGGGRHAIRLGIFLMFFFSFLKIFVSLKNPDPKTRKSFVAVFFFEHEKWRTEEENNKIIKCELNAKKKTENKNE